MTKLYISADLEGVCGVTAPFQCDPEPDRAAYDAAVMQLALEVSTVVDAALEAGVDEILVNDSHCTMTNLGLDHLNPKVALLTGKPKKCAMSAGLDDTFDGAIYVGYHAKAGTQQGVLSHTFHHKLFDVSINGVSYGEGGINALYAGIVHGVPLVMASGDVAFREEIHKLIPDLPVVVTKAGLTQSAALCHPVETVLREYAEKTHAALENRAGWKRNLLTIKAPYELKMTFINTLAADTANFIPGPDRLDGRTLVYRTDDFQHVYQMLQSCYTILAGTKYLES